MPAVMIRQLDALYTVMEQTSIAERRQVLLDQAALIINSCDASVAEQSDRDDVHRRYDALIQFSRKPDFKLRAHLDTLVNAGTRAGRSACAMRERRLWRR